MPSLLSIFRPPKNRTTSAPPGNCQACPQRRRGRPLSTDGPQTTVPSEEKKTLIHLHNTLPTLVTDDRTSQAPAASEENAAPQEEQSASNEFTVLTQTDVQASPDSLDVASTPPIGSPKTVHSQSHEGESRSRSRHSSRRLKKFMSRLHLGQSRAQSTVSESLTTAVPQISRVPQVLPFAQSPEPTTDPIKRDPPSGDHQPIEREALEQRNVSAQTVESQESNHTTETVNRRPSQRNPLSLNELPDDGFWSGILHYEGKVEHVFEGSDPFSDGKNIDSRHQGVASSSRYTGSEDQSTRGTRHSLTSQAISQAESTHLPSLKSSKSRNSAQAEPSMKSSRATSMASHASRGSRLSRIDPLRATVAFNQLSGQLKLPISIPQEDSEAARSEVKTDAEEDEHVRGRFSLYPRRSRTGQVRTSRSHVTLGESTRHPAPKLRRTKTLANLRLRQPPMTSLRGRTVETLARIGGHAYLMLPMDIAPAPLQLPACFVATIIHLRKATPHPAELFVEPGDIKAATRLYNHFARQVLLAEKDERKIAMTTRVVSMPAIESESNATAILSVGSSALPVSTTS
ncbi:Rho GTPase activation protein [Penicillium chermesinum]|nr:Rho GTPase activation protein [Penicillium chermesinum]